MPLKARRLFCGHSFLPAEEGSSPATEGEGEQFFNEFLVSSSKLRLGPAYPRWGEANHLFVGVGPVEFAGFGGDGAGLQGALFDGGHRHDLAVIPG